MIVTTSAYEQLLSGFTRISPFAIVVQTTTDKLLNVQTRTVLERRLSPSDAVVRIVCDGFRARRGGNDGIGEGGGFHEQRLDFTVCYIEPPAGVDRHPSQVPVELILAETD